MLPFKKKRSGLFAFPVRVICASFFVVIACGTFLLMMPFSTRDGVGAGFFDALFTATSATCVTGLVVHDTYSYWSLAGQVVILTLIQIGGLGLVTISSFFNMLIRRKLGFRGMQLAQESVNTNSVEEINRLVKTVMAVSFSVEIVGALLLAIAFVPKYGEEGWFLSLFLSISAFCNAGFDILGREGPFVSLTNYNGDPLVLLTVAALVVVGGLGFVVFADIGALRRRKKLTFHSKLVFAITGILILAGTAMFLLFEWNNPRTMGALPVWQRPMAALFQSITTRTAGFNSLDFGAMNSITKVFSIFLMLVGAAPGSTGGGIKVTTVAVLAMTVISVIRGYEDTVIMKRKVPKQTVYKALAIILIATLGILLAAGTIAFTTHDAQATVQGMDALFESTSAFATVGLTVGVTGIANLPSRLILILTMFMGRVGPVSLLLSLAMREKPALKRTVLPEGQIVVG
ncbi:MAG: potassium transporter TrkG [Oscillospiraceae bacterium]|nr:potassium transporter TrkG [Oscillospiraceae bacterium]